MRDTMYILTRERLDDDSDDTTHELSVFYHVYRAEPDVGIMHDWVELDRVYEGGTAFALTDDEEAEVIAYLERNL